MTLVLYSHPFSSYCQKVLMALWENELGFVYRHLEEPSATEERAALWPLGRFPVLVDDGRTVVESSIIIEHLDIHHAGPVRLKPYAQMQRAKPKRWRTAPRRRRFSMLTGFIRSVLSTRACALTERVCYRGHRSRAP